MAVPVCLALAAREGAVREGFLEKASTQRPIGGTGVRLGRRGPWRRVVPAEGTAGGRHGGTSTQEWVRVRLEWEAGPRSAGLCPR